MMFATKIVVLVIKLVIFVTKLQHRNENYDVCNKNRSRGAQMSGASQMCHSLDSPHPLTPSPFIWEKGN